MSIDQKNDAILNIFATDEDRNELKNAILECAREEVQRTLFALLDSNRPSRKRETSSSSSLCEHTDSAAASKSHTTRSYRRIPQKHRTSSESARSFQCQQQVPSRPLPSPQIRVPLEIDVPKKSKIQRSTSVILEKSVDILTKAAGRTPKGCDKAEDSECNTREDKEVLQRVKSWHAPSRPTSHVSFRPSETSRLIRTSPHSVTNTSRLRPSTTAFQRRSNWTSTVASEKNRALEMGQRLLGPITAQAPDHSSSVIPNSLQINDWQNELQRNIINVFSNKVRSDIKQCDENEDYIPPATATTNNRLVSVGDFVGSEDESDAESDFQRISISRGQSFSCFDLGDNNTLARTDTHLAIKPSRALHSKRKGRSSDGVLRLKMIWLTGTSVVSKSMNWQVLEETDLNVDLEGLDVLEEKGFYNKYIRLVESSIVEWANKHANEEHLDTKRRLWQQLISRSNAFATKSIQQKKYAKAMELLDKSICLLASGLLPDATRKELIAATKETQAYYYICRSKPAAALQYVVSAINIHKASTDSSKFYLLAKCRLYEAFIQNRLTNYDKSMQSLKRILSMVERGVLDVHFDDNKQHVLLLISITYHNIAAQQLMTGHVSDACISSQNARKLARLCLSVSSHYLPILESIHKTSLNQLASQNQDANLFRGLITELFD